MKYEHKIEALDKNFQEKIEIDESEENQKKKKRIFLILSLQELLMTLSIPAKLSLKDLYLK